MVHSLAAIFSHDLMNCDEKRQFTGWRVQWQRGKTMGRMFSQHLTASQETRIAWGYLGNSSGKYFPFPDKRGLYRDESQWHIYFIFTLDFLLKRKSSPKRAYPKHYQVNLTWVHSLFDLSVHSNLSAFDDQKHFDTFQFCPRQMVAAVEEYRSLGQLQTSIQIIMWKTQDLSTRSITRSIADKEE